MYFHNNMIVMCVKMTNADFILNVEITYSRILVLLLVKSIAYIECVFELYRYL